MFGLSAPRRRTVAVVGWSAASARADSGAPATGIQRFDQQMEPILERYLQMGNALSTDSLYGPKMLECGEVVGDDSHQNHKH